MTTIILSEVQDFEALGQRWRDLEERADGSFFQGWTWIGCLAQERFDDPILLEALDGGTTVALALFNRVRSGPGPPTLHLGESGRPALDTPYIEYNGILMARGQPSDLLARCLTAARCAPIGSRPARWARRVVMSGIDATMLDAARAAGLRPRVIHRQPVWIADLAAVRSYGTGYLDRRSANTRQQVRRSDRAYQAAGGLAIRRAESVQEALGFLATLRDLHQAAWRARGEPGAFAAPFFGRFHETLIARGWKRQEVDLWRIDSGAAVVGVLYNFRYKGRSLSYQSGFDYTVTAKQQKPGLTCHHLAIQRCIESGMTCYDFLAGDDRYKRSLSDRNTMLFWAELGTAWTLRGWAGWLREWLALPDGAVGGSGAGWSNLFEIVSKMTCCAPKYTLRWRLNG